MKIFNIIVIATAFLFGHALGDISNPLSQWTDVVLVRKSKDGLSCLFVKNSRKNAEENKLLLNNIKLWAVSKHDKSWIYAIKADGENTIIKSISMVISEAEADVIHDILDDLSQKIDIKNIIEKAENKKK